MFTRIGRNLALLNTFTVILLIATVGLITYLALRHSLRDEVDRALSDRIATLELPDDPAIYNQRGMTPDDQASLGGQVDPSEPSQALSIVDSGDTVLLVIGRHGQVVENPRDVHVEGLPVQSGVEAALTGVSDISTETLAGSHRVRVLTVPIYSDGEVVGAVQGVRSLTELDERLGLLQRVILLGVALGALISAPAGYYLSRRAMKPVNAAFDRQRRFVADASHELRTPMALIRANAEMALLEAPPEAETILPEIKSVLREVDHVDRLIGDLMLIARLDNNALKLDTERRDLAETVGAIVDEMRPIFDAAGIQLVYSALARPMASIDAGRIKQVVRILLDNACKHTPAGGSVEVQVQNGGDHAYVSVSDTGSGIPPEHLERIFDRFYRVDRARSRRSGGTGLGLSIARAITTAHNGEISLESQPGEGTTVKVSLPLAR
ncbi:MAG TPA: ATP-binding protein [Thermomicrobiales bacterium]|nr:ATP-binding protein [Thermomicrobiales bacterium]